MPLSEKNVNAYNIRRAEAFAAAGVNDWDVRWARPEFAGKGHGDCALCGKKDILWIYILHFDAPDMIQSIGAIEKQITRTEAVTFDPVGSECIQTWVEALPESLEKLEFLKRWKIEIQKMNRAKAAQATVNYLKKHGFESVEIALDRAKAVEDALNEAAKHAVGYYAKVLGFTYYDRCALTKLRGRLKRQGRLSHNALKYLIDLIVRGEQARAEQSAKPAATQPAQPAAPAILSDPLMVRAQKVLSDPALLNSLDSYRQSVVKDIVEKVTKFGSFRSASQKGYLESLVVKAEQAVEVATALPTEGPIACGVGPKPGDATFPSPSGIVGARY